MKNYGIYAMRLLMALYFIGLFLINELVELTSIQALIAWFLFLVSFAAYVKYENRRFGKTNKKEDVNQ